MGLFHFEMRENESSLDLVASEDDNVDDDDIADDNTSANETYYSDESASRSASRSSHLSQDSRSQRRNSANGSYSTRGGDDASFDSRETGSHSRHCHDSRSYYSNDDPDRSDRSYSIQDSYRSRSFSHGGSRSDSRSYTSQESETYYSDEASQRRPVSDSRHSHSYSSRRRDSNYSEELSRRSSMDSRSSRRSSYSREGSQSLRERLSERSRQDEDDDYISQGSYSSNSRSRHTGTGSTSHGSHSRRRHGGGGNDDASYTSHSSAHSQRSRRSQYGESSNASRSARSPGSNHSAFQSSYASQVSRTESLFLESANLVNLPLFEGEEEELEHEKSPTNSTQSSKQQQQQQLDPSMSRDNSKSMTEPDSIPQINREVSLDVPTPPARSKQQDSIKSSAEPHSRSDRLLQSSGEDENVFEKSTSVENQPDSTFGMFEQEAFGSSTTNTFGGGGFEVFGNTEDDMNAWGSTTFHGNSPPSSSKTAGAAKNNFGDEDNDPFFGAESHAAVNQLPAAASKSSEAFQQSENKFGNEDDQQDFAWGSTISDRMGESRVSQSQHSSFFHESSSPAALQQSNSKFGGDSIQELAWGSTTSAQLGGARSSPTGSRRSAPNTPSSQEAFPQSDDKFEAEISQEFGWGSRASDCLGGSRVSHSRRSRRGTQSGSEVYQSPTKFEGDDSHELAWGSTTSAHLGESRMSHGRRSHRASSEGLPESNAFGGNNDQDFHTESRASQGEDRSPVFTSLSPASGKKSINARGEDAKAFDWASTGSDHLDRSGVSRPNVAGDSSTFRGENNQDRGQGATSSSLGGSRQLHDEEPSAFMSPTGSLAELELSNMLWGNSHRAGRSKLGLGSLHNSLSHEGPSMVEVTQTTDGTQHSLSRTSPKSSQKNMRSDQMSQGEESRSSGSAQERGMQSKVFAEAEFPNDTDFGNLSVAPIDTKGFSSEDFGEDLFGDSSSRSASVAFRESSEFKTTHQEASWEDKSTFDDDDAFFEQHKDSKPFDFDSPPDAVEDNFPAENRFGRKDDDQTDEQHESKRSDQSFLMDATTDSLPRHESKVKLTDGQGDNVVDDSFAQESSTLTNSHSRSSRGYSSRHSKGLQSGHSRRSRSDRSRRSRHRNSQESAGSLKDSSFGSLAENVSIVSNGSKLSRHSSKSSTMSSKKNRPSISDYLPETRTQSKGASKSIDSRSEAEPSIGLVDVFGASALGPTISEEGSSTYDDCSDRSKESNVSQQSATSSKDPHPKGLKKEGEVQDSARKHSIAGLVARQPASFSTLASDQPSARQRLRSSLKNGDHSGTTNDQGNNYQGDGDPSRGVTFSKAGQDRKVIPIEPDPFGESLPFQEIPTEDSEQSKSDPLDSFMDDLLSPHPQTSFSNSGRDLYELTEKAGSGAYHDGALHGSDSHTPSESVSSSVKQSLSSASQEINKDIPSSPRHDNHTQFLTHGDTISVPSSSQDLDDPSSRSRISQQFSPVDRESKDSPRRNNSVHHSSTEDLSPLGTIRNDRHNHKHSSQSTSTSRQSRSASSSGPILSSRPTHSDEQKGTGDSYRFSNQSLASNDDSQGWNKHPTRNNRKSPLSQAHKDHEGSMSSVEAKSFTSDDISLARSEIYSLKTSLRDESLRNDSNVKSSSSFEASFSSRSYESSHQSHASRSIGDSKKSPLVPRDASTASDPSQRSSQCSGEESSQRSRGPETEYAPKPEHQVDKHVHDELSAGKLNLMAVPPLPATNAEEKEVEAAKQKRTVTADYGHEEAAIHDHSTIHSLLSLKALSVPLSVNLKQVHVSIHNEGYLHAVEVAYKVLVELRPRIRYMLSLAEWIHIHILMLYARVYDCELAAARIAQSKDFRVQLPDSVRVLEPLALALASIGIVEDKVMGVRYIPVARPLHRKATSDTWRPYPYHPPDPDDVTEFLEWTQYNWNSSWIKVEHAREARKALAVVDGIQLPEKSFPVNHAKLLEWENVALEKWLGWDESLWYSYEQTVRLVERKFHFVDFPRHNCMGTYSWLLPLKVVDRTVNTSTSESTTSPDSLVCQVPHFAIGETPEVWMISLLFNFCALHENQTATWYYETTPVANVSLLLSKFMQSAIQS